MHFIPPSFALFHLEKSSIPRLLWLVWKAIDYLHEWRINRKRWSEMKLYSIEGWRQLCRINDGIIRLLQQRDNKAMWDVRWEMKWVFVGFPLGLKERWKKIKSQYFTPLIVVIFVRCVEWKRTRRACCDE